mgnify:CR=1 FL=1
MSHLDPFGTPERRQLAACGLTDKLAGTCRIRPVAPPIRISENGVRVRELGGMQGSVARVRDVHCGFTVGDELLAASRTGILADVAQSVLNAQQLQQMGKDGGGHTSRAQGNITLSGRGLQRVTVQGRLGED